MFDTMKGNKINTAAYGFIIEIEFKMEREMCAPH